MVFLGFALMVGGAGVLIVLRDELGIWLPAFVVRAADRATELLREAVGPPARPSRAPSPSPTVRPPAVGQVVPGAATVEERVLRRLRAERIARRRPSPAPGPVDGAGRQRADGRADDTRRLPVADVRDTSRQRPVSFPRAIGRATPPGGSIARPDRP